MLSSSEQYNSSTPNCCGGFVIGNSGNDDLQKLHKSPSHKNPLTIQQNSSSGRHPADEQLLISNNSQVHYYSSPIDELQKITDQPIDQASLTLEAQSELGYGGDHQQLPCNLLKAPRQSLARRDTVMEIGRPFEGTPIPTSFAQSSGNQSRTSMNKVAAIQKYYSQNSDMRQAAILISESPSGTATNQMCDSGSTAVIVGGLRLDVQESSEEQITLMDQIDNDRLPRPHALGINSDNFIIKHQPTRPQQIQRQINVVENSLCMPSESCTNDKEISSVSGLQQHGIELSTASVQQPQSTEVIVQKKATTETAMAAEQSLTEEQNLSSYCSRKSLSPEEDETLQSVIELQPQLQYSDETTPGIIEFSAAPVLNTTRSDNKSTEQQRSVTAADQLGGETFSGPTQSRQQEQNSYACAIQSIKNDLLQQQHQQSSSQQKYWSARGTDDNSYNDHPDQLAMLSEQESLRHNDVNGEQRGFTQAQERIIEQSLIQIRDRIRSGQPLSSQIALSKQRQLATENAASMYARNSNFPLYGDEGSGYQFHTTSLQSIPETSSDNDQHKTSSILINHQISNENSYQEETKQNLAAMIGPQTNNSIKNIQQIKAALPKQVSFQQQTNAQQQAPITSAAGAFKTITNLKSSRASQQLGTGGNSASDLFAAAVSLRGKKKSSVRSFDGSFAGNQRQLSFISGKSASVAVMTTQGCGGKQPTNNLPKKVAVSMKVSTKLPTTTNQTTSTTVKQFKVNGRRRGGGSWNTSTVQTGNGGAGEAVAGCIYSSSSLSPPAGVVVSSQMKTITVEKKLDSHRSGLTTAAGQSQSDRNLHQGASKRRQNLQQKQKKKQIATNVSNTQDALTGHRKQKRISTSGAPEQSLQKLPQSLDPPESQKSNKLKAPNSSKFMTPAIVEEPVTFGCPSFIEQSAGTTTTAGAQVQGFAGSSPSKNQSTHNRLQNQYLEDEHKPASIIVHDDDDPEKLIQKKPPQRTAIPRANFSGIAVGVLKASTTSTNSVGAANSVNTNSANANAAPQSMFMNYLLPEEQPLKALYDNDSTNPIYYQQNTNMLSNHTASTNTVLDDCHLVEEQVLTSALESNYNTANTDAIINPTYEEAKHQLPKNPKTSTTTVPKPKKPKQQQTNTLSYQYSHQQLKSNIKVAAKARRGANQTTIIYETMVNSGNATSSNSTSQPQIGANHNSGVKPSQLQKYQNNSHIKRSQQYQTITKMTQMMQQQNNHQSKKRNNQSGLTAAPVGSSFSTISQTKKAIASSMIAVSNTTTKKDKGGMALRQAVVERYQHNPMVPPASTTRPTRMQKANKRRQSIKVTCVDNDQTTQESMKADDDGALYTTPKELDNGSTGFHDAIEVPRKTESDDQLEDDFDGYQRNSKQQSINNNNMVRYRSQKQIAPMKIPNDVNEAVQGYLNGEELMMCTTEVYPQKREIICVIDDQQSVQTATNEEKQSTLQDEAYRDQSGFKEEHNLLQQSDDRVETSECLDQLRSDFKEYQQVAEANANNSNQAQKLPIVHRKAENQIYETISAVHSLTRDTDRIFEMKKKRMAKVQQRLRGGSLNPPGAHLHQQSINSNINTDLVPEHHLTQQTATELEQQKQEQQFNAAVNLLKIKTMSVSVKKTTTSPTATLSLSSPQQEEQQEHNQQQQNATNAVVMKKSTRVGDKSLSTSMHHNNQQQSTQSNQKNKVSTNGTSTSSGVKKKKKLQQSKKQATSFHTIEYQ